MRTRTRVALNLVVAVSAASSAVLVWSTAASGTPGGVFSGGASADGTRAGVAVNDFVLVSQLVDVSGPAAQAVVDGFGTSRGYAAIPYPGTVALTAHGQTGGAAPVYPLIAYSSHPSRAKDANSSNGYAMTSTSSADESSALAEGGASNESVSFGRSRSSADVRHDAAKGSVVAVADTEVEAISFAGILRIGRVHSHVSVTAEPGAPVRRTSRTELGQITVAGQAVGLTEQGLVVAGTTVPLPPDSGPNEVLRNAGIEIHYVSGRATDAQTISDAVTVSLTQPVPGTNGAVVTYAIGTASAYAEPGGSEAATGTPPLTDLPAFTDAPPADAGSETGDAGGVAEPAGPVAAAPAAAVAAPAVQPGGDVGGEPDAPPRATLDVGLRSALTSSASFYAVLVLSALALVASSQLFRLLAVRLTWT